MTSPTDNELLKNAGIDSHTIKAVMTIDALLQVWRREAAKRELGQKALNELKAGIDLPHFDVLVAIAGLYPYFNEAQGETMVATVAERLKIDPSRASRLVSEMVDRGFARRAVSQADARRTIIELTEKGAALVDAVRTYKMLIMGDYLSTWSPEELQSFVPLLQKFAKWGEGIDQSGEKFAKELAVLAKRIEVR